MSFEELIEKQIDSKLNVAVQQLRSEIEQLRFDLRDRARRQNSTAFRTHHSNRVTLIEIVDIRFIIYFLFLLLFKGML